jgi:ribosome-associated protein
MTRLADHQRADGSRIMLSVNSSLSIPDDELRLSFSRSSGPGGQNVNKVSSKATLRFAVTSSPSLPDDVRERFLERFASRITTKGEVVIHSDEHRDQPLNIAACKDKLREMLAAVARAPKKRRPTRPTKGSNTRRLKDKKSRSALKEGRQFRGE